METTESAAIDWQAFCGDPAGWLGFANPWVRERRQCASDAYILVTQPTEATDTSDGVRRVNVDAVLKGFELASDWQAPPELEPCGMCAGAGVVKLPKRPCPCGGKSTCRECGGKGYRVCNLGHEHDCDECDGTGHACDDCGDTGVLEAEDIKCRCREKLVSVGGLNIRRHHAWLISRLPEVEIGRCQDVEDIVYIRFAGDGRGAVMAAER